MKIAFFAQLEYNWWSCIYYIYYSLLTLLFLVIFFILSVINIKNNFWTSTIEKCFCINWAFIFYYYIHNWCYINKSNNNEWNTSREKIFGNCSCFALSILNHFSYSAKWLISPIGPLFNFNFKIDMHRHMEIYILPPFKFWMVCAAAAYHFRSPFASYRASYDFTILLAFR